MKASDVEESLGIDFSFQMIIEHPALNVERMFQLSKLLDFHEIRNPDKDLEKMRHDLVVDVISVKERATCIEVKPRRTMTYEEIAKEMDVILDVLSSKFDGKVRATGIEWFVDRKGMASDMRSHQRRVA